MPQYRKIAEERVVTREEYESGFLQREGIVIRKRRYELIRELPDGRYLVRAPGQQGPGQQEPGQQEPEQPKP